MTSALSSSEPIRCTTCGLTVPCICEYAPSLNSQLQIALLTHETEYARLSNTGKLLAQTLPHCTQMKWQRKTPPSEILDKIASNTVLPVLVFPHENALTITECQMRQTNSSTSPPFYFILLDGTWQQARKMYRQSPWLHGIPHLQLADKSSDFTLRRNQVEGAMCTCEVGIHLLNALNETSNAARLEAYFHLFMTTYSKAKNRR